MERSGHGRRIIFDEIKLLVVGSCRRKDFSGAEVVEQGVAADGSGLPDVLSF